MRDSIVLSVKKHMSLPQLCMNCVSAVIAALNEPGKYPGSSGTRNLHDNLSDLRAQVAANQKGINLVQELMDEYSLPVVQAYMAHIQVLAK